MEATVAPSQEETLAQRVGRQLFRLLPGLEVTRSSSLSSTHAPASPLGSLSVGGSFEHPFEPPWTSGPIPAALPSAMSRTGVSDKPFRRVLIEAPTPPMSSFRSTGSLSRRTPTPPPRIPRWEESGIRSAPLVFYVVLVASMVLCAVAFGLTSNSSHNTKTGESIHVKARPAMTAENRSGEARLLPDPVPFPNMRSVPHAGSTSVTADSQSLPNGSYYYSDEPDTTEEGITQVITPFINHGDTYENVVYSLFKWSSLYMGTESCGQAPAWNPFAQLFAQPSALSTTEPAAESA
ncbi:hypothetical protein HPB47_023117 [Ixodes persulcatus]|uniref:Uncharacterized protein n=1 Tax=Ixodes persulcatus TaxID=34615 RepID=A0AC60QA93_IXOPE|nr:hypothetical protein HPB47_023117 [Ixodes persulcatus]